MADIDYDKLLASINAGPPKPPPPSKLGGSVPKPPPKAPPKKGGPAVKLTDDNIVSIIRQSTDEAGRLQQIQFCLGAAEDPWQSQPLATLKLLFSQPGCPINQEFACPGGLPNEVRTPLHYIARSVPENGADIVKILIAAGADVNLVDKNGFTPLRLAVEPRRGYDGVGRRDDQRELRCRSVVEALAASGKADVNRADKEKVTPLHAAISYKHGECVEALLEGFPNIDFSLKNARGETALDVAVASGNRAILTLVEKHQAKSKPAAAAPTNMDPDVVRLVAWMADLLSQTTSQEANRVELRKMCYALKQKYNLQ